MENPWDLSITEVHVLDSLVELGRHKLVAKHLNVATKTIESHFCRIRQKMNAGTTIRAVILWDRWRREKGF